MKHGYKWHGDDMGCRWAFERQKKRRQLVADLVTVGALILGVVLILVSASCDPVPQRKAVSDLVISP